VLRLVHIVCGVLWVGFAVFTGLLLMPALQDVGPMAAGRRGAASGAADDHHAAAGVRHLDLGLWLYAHDSAGFQPSFMTSSVA